MAESARKNTLKSLLPTIILLLVFIVIEELYGTIIATAVGIVAGLAPFLWKLAKQKSADKFLLLDTVLVAILGAVTIIADKIENPSMKATAIGLAISAILGISAYTPFNYLLATAKHSLKMQIGKWQEMAMTANLRKLFWLSITYTTFAFYLPKFVPEENCRQANIWLITILAGFYFIHGIISNKIKMNQLNSEEQLPIVDDNGKVIGKAPRSVCHSDRSLLHPVVHLHVFNTKGELYLQKRSMTKKIQPGKWDTAVGGHISFGEDILTALQRESREEIGLVGFEPIAITHYKWQSAVESEIINVFATVTDKPLISKNDEIDDARFWTLDEIRNAIGKGIMTPNFEKEFANIIDTKDVADAIAKASTSLGKA